MVTLTLNDLQKQITADDGKVLTNGGDFEQYPIELIVNIDDETWYEIDEPIINNN